jgi:hypothetical protein
MPASTFVQDHLRSAAIDAGVVLAKGSASVTFMQVRMRKTRMAANVALHNRFTRIQCIMYCAEYRQLEQIYAVAVRRWAEFASPQTMVPPGRDQLQRATALRQDALVERNSAANTLHLHRQQCLVCKSAA